MISEVWYIYQGTNINNFVAIFRSKEMAEAYKATNQEYVLVKAEIQVPFNAFPGISVTPV